MYIFNLKLDTETISQDTVFIEMPPLNISFELCGIELRTSRREMPSTSQEYELTKIV